MSHLGRHPLARYPTILGDHRNRNPEAPALKSALHFTTLQYTTLHCTVCTTLHSNTLPYTAMHYTAIHYTALMHYTTKRNVIRL